jgi:ubiquinol oxidase
MTTRTTTTPTGTSTTRASRNTTLLLTNPSLPSQRSEPPVNGALDTALHAYGPPTLTPERLRLEQERTLAGPRSRHNPLLLTFFVAIDVLYGRRPSVEKFLVLEHLAQVPYRSWERVAQRRIARSGGRSVLARRIQQRVAEARAQHDNEQWHMLVMEHLIARHGQPLSWWRHRLIPLLLAMPWQVTTWLLHLVRPRWSYQLNAAFEAHAERSYMHFVATHSETERNTFDGVLAARWTVAVTVADVLRQIGHDERVHKLDSERAAKSNHPHAAEGQAADDIRSAA